jgi:hypothetical protein
MNGATEQHVNSNEVIEAQLDERLRAVERHFDSDLLTYFGPIAHGIEGVVKNAVEGMPAPRRAKLLVMLETDGGYIETAERMVRAFRQHYETVEFLVPDFAFSAGTVLVMSGDAIYMDYSSVLGPIDPQVQRSDSTRFAPALGYLVQFERLMKKSAKGNLTTAELFYLVRSFDPAALYQYEQERELSVALLKEWLADHKFKNWLVTADSHKVVTPALRKRRAEQIARMLCETKRWHSHARGIPMETLRRDLNLLIEDFGADPKMAEVVKAYYDLVSDYRMRRGHWFFVLHTRGYYHGHSEEE